jgi:hypothetical protein
MTQTSSAGHFVAMESIAENFASPKTAERWGLSPGASERKKSPMTRRNANYILLSLISLAEFSKSLSLLRSVWKEEFCSIRCGRILDSTDGFHKVSFVP